MTQREYTTASGKKIDFDTMQLKGEDTIAVGNMSVNARGDKLGPGGDVVQSREEVMADYYRIHNGTIPEDKPIGGPSEGEQVDNPITADAVPPTLEADDIDDEADMISSQRLAEALAETADEVKEEPALKSAVAEVLAPTEVVDTAEEAQDEIASSTGKAVEETAPRGGLASAVAKVKQTSPVVKEKTADQIVKDKGGVKRL
jgi:hypothetical protein